MAYLAIARKWRPQRFEDIVGQMHVTRTLQNAIQLGRVHHAFLFTGARGVGKTTAARILAKALNCEQGPTPTPCNECRSCKEITAGIANDVQEIDAASNTGVDNVRDLRDKLRYLPSSGKHKIYIIDEVHMLSTAAFNALLKTLEEPPPHVVFIFATTDPQKVPDTILSRCQRFDFKRIPLKQIVEKLGEISNTEGVEVSESSLLMIAREAEGSMRDAQSLLDQILASAGGATGDDSAQLEPDHQAAGSASDRRLLVDDAAVVEILGIIDRRLIFDCIGGILERDPDRSLEVIDRIYSFGFDIKQFAKELLEVVRHLNVVKVSQKAERFIDVSAEEFNHLRQLASKITLEELSRHFTLLLEGFDEIARSESPRFVLEMTVLRMAQVRPVQALDDLLGRLSMIEGAVRAGGGAGAGARPASPVSAGGGSGPGSSAGSGAGGGAPAGGFGGRNAASEPGSSSVPGAGSRFGGAGSASGRPAFSPPTPARGGGFPETRGGQPSRPSFSKPAPTDNGRSSSGGFQGVPPSEGDEGDEDDHGPGAESIRGAEPAGRAEGGFVDAGARSSATSPDSSSAQNRSPSDVSPVQGRWLQFMDFLVQQGDVSSRAVYLKDAAPVREEPDRIVLGLRTGLMVKHAEKVVAEPEVQQLVRQFFGRPVVLQCTQLGEDGASGQSFLARAESNEKSRLQEIERRELSNPRVKLAASLFRVDPRDLKVEVEKAK